jgi:hypothetical protein
MPFFFKIIISFFIYIGCLHAAPPDWSKATETHADEKEIFVYYSKSCGCCKKWMSHLDQHGFKVNPIPVKRMNTLKKDYGIPLQYASCHTAVIGDYLVEGHVPADDIKRLLKDKPANIKALTVPAMPVGTPGMEMGERKDPFAVYAIMHEGEPEVYRAYEEY